MGNKRTVLTKRWNGFEEQWGGKRTNVSLSVTQTFDRQALDDPKFKSKIKNGQSATNYMLVTIQDVNFHMGRLELACKSKSAIIKDRWGKTVTTTALHPNTVAAHTQRPGILFRSEVGNRALIGVIKKIRKYESSDFSGPTFAGELRETLSMIRSPLKSLRTKTGLFTDLHMRILRDKQAKGGRFKPDPWRKVISDTWLEWTFGAAPLMNDISAICDLYLESKNERFGQRGLKRLSYRFSDTYHIINQAGVASFDGAKVPYNEVNSYRASSQYVVWVDNDLVFLGDQGCKNLVTMSKFDLSEIIPTAWELLPWSFLIDYFTNIGDVLGSTFDYNRNIVFAKLTEEDSCVRYHVPGAPYAVEPNDYYIRSFEPWTYTSMYKTLRRNRIESLGFPQLSVSLPSLGQANNILALLSSLQSNNPFKGHTLK